MGSHVQMFVSTDQDPRTWDPDSVRFGPLVVEAYVRDVDLGRGVTGWARRQWRVYPERLMSSVFRQTFAGQWFGAWFFRSTLRYQTGRSDGGTVTDAMRNRLDDAMWVAIANAKLPRLVERAFVDAREQAAVDLQEANDQASREYLARLDRLSEGRALFEQVGV